LQKRATTLSWNHGEQRCTVGIPPLLVESTQRNLSNAACGNEERLGAPVPKLEDGEWEAPGKLTRDCSAKRAELAGC
jgi:hypothetical protein